MKIPYVYRPKMSEAEKIFISLSGNRRQWLDEATIEKGQKKAKAREWDNLLNDIHVADTASELKAMLPSLNKFDDKYGYDKSLHAVWSIKLKLVCNGTK